MAEPSTVHPNLTQPRQVDNTERFVAFAFAAADLVLEIEPDGRISYAAGAFRARLGKQPDAFVGGMIQDVVCPADHPALEMALMLLREKGRLAPLMIRLAAADAPAFALAGLALAPVGCPTKFCLTLAKPPAPLQSSRGPSPQAFARLSAARARAQAPCDVGFVELTDPAAVSSNAFQEALSAVAPNSVASELAPGRFGVLGAADSTEFPAVLQMLEESLRSSAGSAIMTERVSLPAEGLTSLQTARALGQALIVFARNGQQGLKEGGFTGGLAGYVDKAAKHSGSLRRALKERRFELLFQPIVSIADRKLHHYEALLRPKPIKHCEFASPQEFVLLAETLGLAGELDLAVAEVVCDAAAQSPVPIAFNSSGQSIQDPRFRDQLLSLLSASPACRAGRITVEMTETAEVENLAEAARTVEALRALGVPFCLDDFGAGTADVRILRALPADTVKLDGSFVPGVAAGGRERGFVTGIVEIARATGATVVAERIETEAEAEALHAVGAAYGQGWLFGKPAPLPAYKSAGAGRRAGERESWG